MAEETAVTEDLRHAELAVSQLVEPAREDS